MDESMTMQTPATEATRSTGNAQQARDIEALRSEQRLIPGLLSGLAAAALGSGIWAVVSAATGQQIGYTAIGVGLLVGLTVRLVGKGVDATFGIIGASLALVACVTGNLFTILHVAAQQMDVSYSALLAELNVTRAIQLMQAFFAPVDLVFYALAVSVGYQVSIRDIDEEETPATTEV